MSGSRLVLAFLVLLDALLLFSQTSQFSISYRESVFLEHFSVLSFLTNISLEFFTNRDIGLRFVVILLHLMSAILLYIVSKEYLFKQKDRLWLVFIFMLLPGSMSSAIVVNEASLLIFGLFLFMFVEKRYPKYYLYSLLILFSFLAQDFIYLFSALLIFSIYKKDKECFTINLSAILISLYNFNFVIKGVPSNHFMDILGIYAAVFSPIIFIYIFYTLYRYYLKKEIDKIWFVATFVFIYTIALSFRQKIYIEHYAPYFIMALPLAAKTFIYSYRIRLKMYRVKYKFMFFLAVIFLGFNALVVFYNKKIYNYLEKPQKHFAYDMHIAKDLAKVLKENKIDCIDSNRKMEPRLKFYGVGKCTKYVLHKHNLNISPILNVEISYNDRVVYKRYVTKINSKESYLKDRVFLEEINK